MQLPRDLTDPRSLRFALEQLVKQFDNTGSVTLTPFTTTTVVVNGKVNPNSVVVLEPQSASAAAERATTYAVSGSGSFTITHADSPAADRKFGYVIHGV